MKISSRRWLRVGLLVFVCVCGSGYVFAQEITETVAVVAEGDVPVVTEENVSIDFKDADIKNVLRVLALKSGVNIVAGDEVTGNVTIRLTDVPWEKALDIVLRTYGFTYERDENVIRVTTIENLKNEELVTESYTLNYANASDVTPSIQEMLSERGRVRYDKRTNSILVTDIPQNLDKVEKIIIALDRMTPQVLVESKMIETTLGDDEKLGINWTTQFSLTGSARPTTFPFDAAKGGTRFLPGELLPTNDTADAGFPGGNRTEFPEASATDFTFGTLNFTSFQAVLEVLKSRSDTKVVSNPRIVAMNNKEAKIIVGTRIPIPIYELNNETGFYGITGYDEEEVGVKLTVTPSVNQQGYITMKIHPEVSSILSYTGPNNERPIISTREVTTEVIVRDGQTIAIGGLIKEQTIDSHTKVPVLGDIPILGLLFKKKSKEIDTTDLLIFITPRIMRDEILEKVPDSMESEVVVGDEAPAAAELETETEDLTTDN